MNHPSIVVAAACLASIAGAQQSRSLLFTPRAVEQTASGSAGTFLRWLRRDAIAVVTPVSAGNYSAERFSSDWNYQTMAGDTNASGSVANVGLLGGMDAILSLPYVWDPQSQTAQPRTAPVTAYDTYVSPGADVGTFVSGAPGLRKGDCGRFVRNAAGNGQVEYFIRAEQIIAALGMVNQQGQPLVPDDINLDAIAVSQSRHIFLSFDADHTLRLWQNGVLTNFLLQDAGVACIRAPWWTPNARGEVGAVSANHGIIALSEPQVDGMVAGSAIADHTGVNPGLMTDTEGLAPDRNGGTFPVVWGTSVFNLPNLMLSGETLTGAGVITTAGGIATVNGVLLGSPAGTPSTGVQMGMLAVVDSCVDNLESLAQEPCYFVLGTPNPYALPGALEVHIGTNINPVGGLVYLGYGLGALPVSQSIDFTLFVPGTQCFPALYPTILPNPLLVVPLAAAGGGRFGSIMAAAPAIAGGILFQAIGLDPALVAHLSAPGTID